MQEVLIKTIHSAKPLAPQLIFKSRNKKNVQKRYGMKRKRNFKSFAGKTLLVLLEPYSFVAETMLGRKHQAR